jgi:hypothetical protein
LKAICGRDAKAVREVAGKFGWETAVTNWRVVIDDPEIDIIVTEPTHPYIANCWPPGHIIGYEHVPVAVEVEAVGLFEHTMQLNAARSHELDVSLR